MYVRSFGRTAFFRTRSNRSGDDAGETWVELRRRVIATDVSSFFEVGLGVGTRLKFYYSGRVTRTVRDF